MGLFSSKKKTTVGTSVVRAIGDDEIHDRMPQSVIRALLSEESIVDHLLEGTLQSTNYRVERMLRYANDGYYYGLPNSKVIRSNDNQNSVKAAIEAETGRSITLLYLDLTPPNANHIAWQVLSEDYGYDPGSNELAVLSAQEGQTVWLKDFTAVYSEEDWNAADDRTRIAYGDPPTHGYTPDRPGQAYGNIGKYRQHTEVTVVPTEEGDTPVPEHVEVVYVFGEAGNLTEKTLSIPLGLYDLEGSYFQAGYTYTAGGQTRQGYWTYQDGSGAYPTVDALTSVEAQEAGVFFPFVVFRRNKTNLADSSRKGSAEYDSTAKLMEKLGMDFASIGEAIHQNEDIADVQQAVLQFAVPANSQHPLDKQYLFAFFDNLHTLKPSAEERVMTRGKGFGRTTDASPGNALILNDGGFRSTLSYAGITKRKAVKKIGAVGTVQNTTRSESREETYQSYENIDRGEMGYVTRTRTVYTHYRVYRKQVTAQICEEIEVRNPQLRFSIYKQYDHVADYDDKELLIPLEQGLTKVIDYTDRNEFYQRTMHYVFNSRVTVKVKWYESTFFRNILTVAAIVITIYSMGTQAHLIAAAAAVGTATLAWTVATVIIKALVIKYGTELFVKEVGAEAAFLAAVVAAVASAYYGMSDGGDFSITTGEGLVAVSSNVAADLASGISGAIQDYTQGLLDGLQDDWASFNSMAEEQMARLEASQELLETSGLVDPLLFTAFESDPLIVETPDDLYQRTIHAGNIGTMALEIPHVFVEQSLRLPDINDVINGEFYE